ncbi:Ankrd17 [Symbiodinium natans]|uniref:Ankrd17 protein n=1 Tax=Symbiodinium natans TaxID=878477 RepID=A0A812N8T7_9DINO|nr:Ankrd17 [Symbiodinium natans]
MSSPPAEVVKGLQLTNADDEAMTMISYRTLEEDRRKVFASAFPECASGHVLAIVARGSQGDHKEFIAVLKDGATSAELVSGSCQITFEDLSPADCIEYSFAEAPGEWRVAQVSREALETYRGMKFEAWKQMLLKPTCEAQFRRMLQLGIVTQLYDPQLFPTPDASKAQYQVTDDRTGKLIQLPHAVKEMRVWNAALQQYDSIDTKLSGAPAEAEKAAWWKDFTDKMKAEHGEEYIDGLIAGKN